MTAPHHPRSHWRSLLFLGGVVALFIGISKLSSRLLSGDDSDNRHLAPAGNSGGTISTHKSGKHDSDAEIVVAGPPGVQRASGGGPCFGDLRAATTVADASHKVPKDSRDSVRRAFDVDCACWQTSGKGNRAAVVPLLWWVDVRMHAFQRWAAALEEAEPHWSVATEATTKAAEQLLPPLNDLTRPISAYGATVVNHSRLASTSALLLTPVAFLGGEMEASLDLNAACRLVRAGSDGAAAKALSPELWQPGTAITWMRHSPHAPGSAVPASPFAFELARRAHELAQSSGADEEVLTCGGSKKSRSSGGGGCFLSSHLEAAWRTLDVAALAAADSPARVRLPSGPLKMNSAIFYDLHYGNDIFDTVQKQFSAAEKARKEGVTSPPGGNAWMYVNGGNINHGLHLMTLPDAFFAWWKPKLMFRLGRQQADTNPAAAAVADTYTQFLMLSNVYWHGSKAPAGALRADHLASVQRAKGTASQPDGVFPVWTLWPDNHFHIFVEAHTRTALALPWLGYSGATTVGDWETTANDNVAGGALGLAGLVEASKALLGPNGPSFHLHSTSGLHVMDSTITNWPPMQGIIALRERVRAVLGLPQASLSYLAGGKDAAALPLPSRAAVADAPAAAAQALDSSEAAKHGCPSSYKRPPRILLFRRRATRALTNHDALEKGLRSIGAAAVQVLDDNEVRKMPLRDQLAAFASADVIVSPHGAALSNIVAADAGTILVEVVPSEWPAHFYMHMSLALGLPYSRIEAPGEKASPTLEAPLAVVMGEVCARLSQAEKAATAAAAAGGR